MVERPIECSHCKKPIQVVYKEIVGASIICTEMCADCPILQQKLHGSGQPGKPSGIPGEKETGLYCGNCHTGLDSVKMGNFLGCSTCYSVFGDLLVNELIAQGRLPPHLIKNLKNKKNIPLHNGKTPENPVVIPPSSRLVTLNEALNDALKRENYEQAAWIRDQIKALKEPPQDV